MRTRQVGSAYSFNAREEEEEVVPVGLAVHRAEVHAHACEGEDAQLQKLRSRVEPEGLGNEVVVHGEHQHRGHATGGGAQRPLQRLAQ
eukprot:1179988-Prorocentrum_minimum.AAC.2